jgi:hypothetical protein
MDGVMDLKREFSSDYSEIDEWKFTVEYEESGTIIKYIEKVDKKWVCKQEITISACCDELLFKTIAKDFENGEVAEIRG